LGNHHNPISALFLPKREGSAAAEINCFGSTMLVKVPTQRRLLKEYSFGIDAADMVAATSFEG